MERADREPPLTALETASGVVLGGARLDPLAGVEPSRSPVEALEAVLLPLLTREPCCVSFSGGRDSSVVLAVATRLARREGLATPLPVSYGFRDGRADERDWQRVVLDSLGIERLERIEVGEELDLLGPIARGLASRHGLRFPANGHFHVPMLELARGGVLITGSGGDELLGEWRTSRAADVLARRSPPSRSDWRTLARAFLPAGARRALLAHRQPAVPAWLSPTAREQLAAQLARELADEPSFWTPRALWRARRRWRALTNDTLGLFASEVDVTMAHPLTDPLFVAAVAQAGGTLGFGDRTRAMRAIFNGILPDRVLGRSSKAVFNDVFWSSQTRHFLASWDGRCSDATLGGLIDTAALRQAVSLTHQDARTGQLVQALGLLREGGQDARPVR